MSQTTLLNKFQVTKHVHQGIKTAKQDTDEPVRSNLLKSPQLLTEIVSSPITTQSDLEIIESFDLNYKYGPMTGITRLERWDRAEAFGLQPPKRVREILCSGSSEISERSIHDNVAGRVLTMEGRNPPK